jgi:hypothetical protein
MTILTIDGPGGPRSLVIDDPDLLATIEANARRDGIEVHVDDDTDAKPAPELTVAELRRVADELGLEVPKGIKKADLVDLIEAHQAASSNPDPDAED